MPTLPDPPPERPARAQFSSGPCVKPPGWTAAAVAERAWLGRSHRARRPRDQIREALARTRRLLELPDSHRIGIVPGSNTGAFEMAMWNLLGPRPVDVLVWDNFGREWSRDAREELALDDCRVLEAPYGQLPDLGKVRRDADIVFAWNGTTAGARVPDACWISESRQGMTLCDATSAVFAQELDWQKLDATTFSWQKALGGEAAHGMLVLSPRAVERIIEVAPLRAQPKVFRLAKAGVLDDELFDGATINTPSMLSVADWLFALDWAESVGGAAALRRRADANCRIVQAWIDRTGWIENLVAEPDARSNTSVCMRLSEEWFNRRSESDQRKILGRFGALLEEHQAAYDIVNHRAAPPGLRVWCGPTVEESDLVLLTGWLDWAHACIRLEFE